MRFSAAPFVMLTLGEGERARAKAPFSLHRFLVARDTTITTQHSGGGGDDCDNNKQTTISRKIDGAAFSFFFFQDAFDGNSTVSVLTLRPRLEDVGKRLSCVATNAHIKGASMQDEITLRIDCESRK